MELRTTSFIESTGVACSDSVSHNRVQVLRIPVFSKKAVIRGEIEKSGIADHIWKGNHLSLWDEVEIIDRAEHWGIRHHKESAHTLGYNDLLSIPSKEMNTIWEPIIKKVR